MNIPDFCLYRRLTILLLFAIASSHAARATPLNMESVSVQTAAHMLLTPQTVVATADDGIVVGGGSSASKETWAVKFDAANRLQWQYTRQAPPAERQAVIDGASPSSYHGVAEMADGSFFLCAEKPFNRSGLPASMYLTHLNRDGQLLGELPISSNSIATGRNFFLAGCAAWGGNLAVLAYEMSWPPGPVMGLGRLTYLLLVFEPSGALKWELPVVSFQAGTAPDPDGVVFQETGASLTVSATGNVSTELMRFSASGEISAHRKAAGRQLLVHRHAGTAALKLLGLSIGADGYQHTLTVLDDDLAPVSAVSAGHPAAFLVSSVFEKADGTLLMFGSEVNREGTRQRAGIRQVAASLDAEWPLATAFAQFKDPFSIVTATLRRNGEAFAYATAAEPRDPGVVVNFIK